MPATLSENGFEMSAESSCSVFTCSSTTDEVISRHGSSLGKNTSTFFYQRFAYRISKILGESLIGDNTVMCLGGTADLAAQKGLKAGSYK